MLHGHPLVCDGPFRPEKAQRQEIFMPVRVLLLAAMLAAGSLLTFAPVAADGVAPIGPPSPSAAAADSFGLDPAAVLSRARVAYDRAWELRRADDHAGAIKVLDVALADVRTALVASSDFTLRQQLTDLQARMSGLREAAQHELSTQPPAAADSADAPMLDQPAIEDLQPQVNADVYRHIQFFTGAGRSTFERWLKRSGRYMNLFREVLQREGLPPDLVHLVFVESGFNMNARSVSAAVGPWQFLQGTGRMFGLTVNQWVDERKDPEKATVAAARYLKHLYTIFGDWPLALASYNAGEGTVLRAIKSQGTTNYWDLKLPKQTEEYVPAFMAVLTITRDPEKYGFDGIELEQPMEFEEIALKGTADLRVIAKLADCSVADLQALNPALRGHAAPASKDGITTLRVPPGKAAQILQQLEGGVSIPPVDLTVKHRVRRGETLAGIASQYGVDASALARANGISRAHPLQRGMTLTVRSTLRPARLRAADLEPDDPRASTDYVPPRDIKPLAQIDGLSEADGRATITVHRGETLASIAARHGTTVEDIRATNHLRSDAVRPGLRLKVRDGDAPARSPESLAADSASVASIRIKPRASSHRGSASGHLVVVRSGQTLGEIAAKNGTTVAKIKSINGMRSSTIRAGQRLRLPA